MKNSLLGAMLLLFLLFGNSSNALAQSKNSKKTKELTTVWFKDVEHDFGSIQQGENVTYQFEFQNTGDAPLYIQSAKSSCGCTISKYPKTPIEPNQWSQISVKFKSANKEGEQIKVITIRANTEPNPIHLAIKANVIVGKMKSLADNINLPNDLPNMPEAPLYNDLPSNAILSPEIIPDTEVPNTDNSSEPKLPNTTIEFTETEHDFGEIKHRDIVSHTFTFKNTGTEPLIINSAKGSCGCTVPNYPKEPIAPGQTAAIDVTFNSTGKSGSQTKTVTINANTDPNPTRLTVKAQIITPQNDIEEDLIPKSQVDEMGQTINDLPDAFLLPETSLDNPEAPLYNDLPNDAILLPELASNPESFNTNDVRLPKTTIEFTETEHDFGPIKQGEKVSYTFTFKNTGTEPLIINSAKGSCGCTVPNYPKEPIAPGQTATIDVTFDSAGKSGDQSKTVTINANTDPNPTRLTVKAQIITPQNDIAEDLITELQFDEMEHNFGTVSPNQQLTYTFRFKNIGNMPFILDQANCGCGCTVVKQPKNTIEPNKSGSVKIRLDATEKLGELDKKLYISGNVPNNFYELDLHANVAASTSNPISDDEHTHSPSCIPPPPSKFRNNDSDSNENTIRIFPTSSSDGIINIIVPNNDSNSANISVFDMSGKIVMRTKLPDSNSIELPSTAANYIIQVETDTMKVMRKVEKY